MKSAIPVVFRQTRRGLTWSLLLAVVLGVAGLDGGLAQSLPAPGAVSEAPPVSVSGWRYQRDGDVHKFSCEAPACGASSRVSYRFYAPDRSTTLDQFRSLQEQVIKALDQRVPGQKTSILGAEGDKGTGEARMFKVRRLRVAPDGAKEYQASGMLFGPRGSATLISSASNERDSTANFGQFAVPVMIVLAMPEKKS